ncbi:GtrA family protein [Novosphingobium colocasiae]
MAALHAIKALLGHSLASTQLSGNEYFILANTLAAIVAMTFNFVLNNELTYSDKRLRGFGPLMKGWAQFALTCSLGLLTNVGSAAVLKSIGINEMIAVVGGIVLGSVWNFALSSKFVWGKY